MNTQSKSERKLTACMMSFVMLSVLLAFGIGWHINNSYRQQDLWRFQNDQLIANNAILQAKVDFSKGVKKQTRQSSLYTTDTFSTAYNATLSRLIKREEEVKKQAAKKTWLGAVDSDKREIKARQLAGPKAIDCGYVTNQWSNERIAVDARVLAAFKAKKPFRVRYINEDVPLKGDSILVGNSRGQFFWLIGKQNLISETQNNIPATINVVIGRQTLSCHVILV